MTENNNNLTCEFGEELVSYLYDELESANKTRFEGHLKSCITCSEELSGFALTRSAVTEWRDAEFSPLALPEIKIPYKQFETPEISGEKLPWYAAIRDLFSLSPAWMTAATAGAALVISLGLFVALDSNSGDNKILVQQSNSKISPSPTTEIKVTDPDTKADPTVSRSNEKLPESASIDKVIPSSKVAPTTIKVTSNPKPLKTQNLTVVKSSPKIEPKNTKVNKNAPKKAPGLVEDEEEDDSLRLSDILEEISMR